MRARRIPRATSDSARAKVRAKNVEAAMEIIRVPFLRDFKYSFLFFSLSLLLSLSLSLSLSLTSVSFLLLHLYPRRTRASGLMFTLSFVCAHYFHRAIAPTLTRDEVDARFSKRGCEVGELLRTGVRRRAAGVGIFRGCPLRRVENGLSLCFFFFFCVFV